MTDTIFTDTLASTMSGFFEIKTINRSTGEVVDEYTDPNVIVIDAKEAIINTISSLANTGVIQTIKVGDDVGGDVTMTGTPNLNFADANPDTITRTTGSWITDGFIDDMSIVITTSVSNNSTFTIDTLTATTITLVAIDTLVVETGTSGVSVVGTPSPNNPAAPLDTFNASSMSVVYAPTVPFTVGYSNVTSVTFSVTISGADLMALYPAEITKILTSAALHTGNAKVFAYKRFPQKSISALLDILINWTIKFD